MLTTWVVGSALDDTIGLDTEFLTKADSATIYPSRHFQLVDPATALYRDTHRGEFLLWTETTMKLTKPYGIDRFAALAWTDDTDQALLILLSYLHNSTLDSPNLTNDHLSRDFAARLNIWLSQGLLCLHRHAMGIGSLVGSIVSSSSFLTNPIQVATTKLIGSKRFLAPNGSLMRTHPIGVIGVSMSEEETWRLATDVGRCTHVDPRCVVSCCIEVARYSGESCWTKRAWILSLRRAMSG